VERARAEGVARISVVDRASKNKAQSLPGEIPMRLHLRRFTAVIFLVATMLGLAVPAIEVYTANEYHVHQGIEISGTPTLASWAGIQPPFWPRYLRRLTGRPWRRQPCTFRTGFDADRCEFAYPDMAVKIGNRVAYQFDSDLETRLEEILAERTKQSRAEQGADLKGTSTG
jgi:hypothetical protein